MSRVLAVNVVVVDEESGEPVVLLAGSTPTAEQAEQITNAKCWADEAESEAEVDLDPEPKDDDTVVDPAVESEAEAEVPAPADDSADADKDDPDAASTEAKSEKRFGRK